MRFVTPIVAVALLFCGAATTSAQFDDVSRTEYQRPAAESANADIESRPRQLPPANTGTSVPLKPPPADHGGPSEKTSGLHSLITILGALAVVLGLFFLVLWLMRRASPRRFGPLPSEVFEVLGRASLANHQQAELVRCGGKLLLISTAAATGAGSRTLTEIADADEVERLTDLCRQAKASGPTKTFGNLFKQVENRHG